jgi:hypothetical protein
MSFPIVIIGCDHLTEEAPINKDFGIFRSFKEEHHLKLRQGKIIPARENTKCPHRRGWCNINCVNAINCWVVVGRISNHQIGKRI